MRLGVEAAPGTLAQSPDEALSALADMAEADGAVREDWLEKAAKAAGATQVEARASREPRFKIYADTVDRSMGLYGRVIGSMLDEIDAVLEGAIPSATKRGFELAREAGAGPASGEPDG